MVKPVSPWDTDLVAIQRVVALEFGCDGTLEQNDTTREVFLRFHNDVRKFIALGIYPNKVGVLGPAKNMYQLKWSCDLEEEAHESIYSCSYNPLLLHPQSYSKLLSVDLPDTDVVGATLEMWTEFMRIYGVNTKTNSYNPSFSQFANMAYSKNTKVGCSYKKCGGDTLVTCVYELGVKLPSHPQMWENGPTCVCVAYTDSICNDNNLCEYAPTSAR
ncbi:unnamed protein product [Heligmosomoides polygyrus]|uniref:SCP domain-containing protein n=1 Tax=Heligmosomoides polygyrus TaxID=6339 RepID=A0A3P8H493_HELPZ|nr:unnamed protein product [Heligmosomoides polygyrus]